MECLGYIISSGGYRRLVSAPPTLIANGKRLTYVKRSLLLYMCAIACFVVRIDGAGDTSPIVGLLPLNIAILVGVIVDCLCIAFIAVSLRGTGGSM